MIRVSVFYPNTPGGKLDHQYFAGQHMDLVNKRLGPMGLIRTEVDRGLGGGAPDAPAPFIGVGHLYFNSLEQFQTAFNAHGAELVADIPNYTDIEPQFQISEILPG